jgi:predicted negative regulator of RcsB-dependent stress response
MSDEYESSHVEGGNVYYSPFWPLTIVLLGFTLWLGYQIFISTQQRMASNSQLNQMVPTLQQADTAQKRLVALMQDLAQTSAKDPYANQIIKQAIAAGLLRVNPTTNAAAAPAAPASSTDSTDSSAAAK